MYALQRISNEPESDEKNNINRTMKRFFIFTGIFCLLINYFIYGQTPKNIPSPIISHFSTYPQRKVFSDTMFNFNYSVFQFHSCLTTMGKNSIRNLKFYEGETVDYSLDNWSLSTSMNYINWQTSIEFFRLSYLFNREKGIELSYSCNYFSAGQLSISDNYFNILIMGMPNYINQHLYKIFNTESYGISYLRTTYGINKDFLDNRLRVGFFYHWYGGIQQSSFEITESDYIAYPVDSSHSISKGTIRMLGKENTFFDQMFSGISNVSFNNHLSPIFNNNSWIFSDNLFNYQGRGISIGINYQLNKNISISANINDLGWLSNPKSYYEYTISVDSTNKWLPNINYDSTTINQPKIDTSSYSKYNHLPYVTSINYFITEIKSIITTSNLNLYLPTLFEVGSTYKFNERYTLSFFIQKYRWNENIQFTTINSFSIFQKIFLAVNLGTGTLLGTTGGCLVGYESRRINFFLGSQQLLNLIPFHIPLGVDFRYGKSIYF
ncbi:MAG: hypothetical protein A3H98_06280 [Bacteroidetes bacterium RIFCSPLOWO2_02_FULL_36_8]|nr:MAG: hypothetical protein A3H98_06280 [Bacteroidetes bacterium RIFCSPLOWO2_02_FULL_36_8]OFY69699.1 MAG: hypothetical protein A3G23_14340 [Bacteroidetes bacterium RIFCSPLOWO2_12_FULL_37_12]